MSAELEDNFDDVEIKLVASGNGIFDVLVNGRLVYSKFRTERFPEAGEVTKLLS